MLAKKIAVALSLVLVGCVTSDTADIEILTEPHPNFHLASYGSYSWDRTAFIVFDIEGRWEPPDYDLDAEIKFLLDSEMRELGLVENSSNPDMILSFATAIDMQSLQTFMDPQAALELPQQVSPQGALAVVMRDARTGYLLWLGVATADVEETPSAELSRLRLQYAVTNMLEELPK